VIVIDKGSLVYEGTFDSLVAEYGGGKQLRLVFGGDDALPDLSEFGEVLGSSGRTVTLSVPKETVADTAGRILRTMPIVDIAIEEVSVDAVVLRLFEHGA